MQTMYALNSVIRKNQTLWDSVYTRGYLVINRVDLGKIVFSRVAHVGGLFGKDNKKKGRQT